MPGVLPKRWRNFLRTYWKISFARHNSTHGEEDVWERQPVGAIPHISQHPRHSFGAGCYIAVTMPRYHFLLNIHRLSPAYLPPMRIFWRNPSADHAILARSPRSQRCGSALRNPFRLDTHWKSMDAWTYIPLFRQETRHRSWRVPAVGIRRLLHAVRAYPHKNTGAFRLLSVQIGFRLWKAVSSCL